MRRSSRFRTAVLAVALTALVGPPVVAGPAGAHEDTTRVAAASKSSKSRPGVAAEQVVLQRMNEERAEAGLDALDLDPALVPVARSWSATMARSRRLSHNPALRAQVSQATPGWVALAENVGVGTDVDALHAAFMASKGHRRNVLGNFDRVGVGVEIAGGRTWVTVQFVRARLN